MRFDYFTINSGATAKLLALNDDSFISIAWKPFPSYLRSLLAMPEAVRIVGIEDDHFSRPPETVPFGINICPNGTLRLGNVSDGNEWNDFPIILRVRDLNEEIHLEDNSGRLALSWSSSKDHAAQLINLARADEPVSPPPSLQTDHTERGFTSFNTTEVLAGLSRRSVLSNNELWIAESTQSSASSLRSTTRASRLRAAQPHTIARNQRTFVMKTLWSLVHSHREFKVFNNLVNASQYSDYSKIIKHSMNFHTIHRNYKSSKSYYSTVDAIMTNFNLIIRNAIKYIGVRHDISQRARNIKSWFEERMKRLPAPEGARKRTTSSEEGSNTIQKSVISETSLRFVVESVKLASSLSFNDIKICRETIQSIP